MRFFIYGIVDGIAVSFDAKNSFSEAITLGAGGMTTTHEFIKKCRNHCLNPQFVLFKRGGHAGVLANLVADVFKAKFLFKWIRNAHLVDSLSNTVAHHAEN